MTSKIDYQEEQRVFSILMMRFGLDPYQSINIIEAWLEKHQEKSYKDLEQYLLQGEIIYQNGQLKDIDKSKITALTKKIKSKNGIKLKTRWDNFHLYRQCFIGSEFVLWLMKNEKLSKKEAIQLGQTLVDRGIIYKLGEGEKFNSSNFSFYRFCKNPNKAIVKDYNLNKLLAN